MERIELCELKREAKIEKHRDTIAVRRKLKPRRGAVNKSNQVRKPHGLFLAWNVLQPTFTALCVAVNSVKQATP